MMRTISLVILLIFFTASGLLSQGLATTPVAYPTNFTVAKDGSGNFKTIQEAINAVRDLSQQRVTIFIKDGLYQEKIVVPSWKINITLVGESQAGTILSNNDYSGKPFPNGVDAMGKDKFNTFNSYTLLVQGNDFSAENLTIQNTSGPVGQAVALHIEADRVLIKNCRLLGYQDTLYVAKDGCRQLFDQCFIEGTTDFIFGDATVVFRQCIIRSLKNSYITAASTKRGQQYGFVFFDCDLIADSSVNKVFLGRPWRPYAQTVFIHTKMGKHILPAGWDNWRNAENEKTAFYAEYKSMGDGGNVLQRVPWSKQLTRKQARHFTIEKIFATPDAWQPK